MSEKGGPSLRAGSGESLFPPLGIYGLDSVESVIIAALITEEPLLLIGTYGSGKSYLLVRVARALGLNFRHYNASLLQFDDLIGFPVPNGKGGIDYARTEDSIWPVEAAFVDEIARCRVDMQNKLFPIIHEKKVQGIGLPNLRYRWSAMNPPPSEKDPGRYECRGCEPLDAALADRFALIVPMPEWETFSEVEQESIILAQDGEIDAAAATRLRFHVQSGKKLLAEMGEQFYKPLACYVRIFVSLLRKAGVEISARRSNMIVRNILAVHVTRLLKNVDADLAVSTLHAVKCSMPHQAMGEDLPTLKVMTAHGEAWELARLAPGHALRWLLLESSPIRRALLAAQQDLSPGDLATIVADCLSELPVGGRHALAAALFERNVAGKLLAAVAEQAAQLHAMVSVPPEPSAIDMTATLAKPTWEYLSPLLQKHPTTTHEGAMTRNLLLNLFLAGSLGSPGEVDRVLLAWQQARQKIQVTQ